MQLHNQHMPDYFDYVPSELWFSIDLLSVEEMDAREQYIAHEEHQLDLISV